MSEKIVRPRHEIREGEWHFVVPATDCAVDFGPLPVIGMRPMLIEDVSGKILYPRNTLIGANPNG